ncbi:MAG: lysophospholipid acyltransferase family protein [Deferrisomatales bacterium]
MDNRRSATVAPGGKTSLLQGVTDLAVYWVSTGLVWAYFRYLGRGQVVGSLPAGGGAILTPNHVSYLDWLVLHLVLRFRFGRRVRFVAKERLLQNPLWRNILRQTRCVVVGESRLSLGAVREIERALAAGELVVIFPEGTRSADGRLGAARRGVGWLVARCGVPVVPVALGGFYENWPRHKRLPRVLPRPMTVRIGSPLSPAAALETAGSPECFGARLIEAIRSLGEEMQQ